MKSLLIFSISISFFSCNGQHLMSVEKIYDTKIESYVAKYKNTDPGYFNHKDDFWIQTLSSAVLGIDGLGIKYIYDFEKKQLKKIDGMFAEQKKILLKHDFTGGISFNFYLDGPTIGWLTKPTAEHLVTLRLVNTEENFRSEKTFIIPRGLREIEPLIFDTTSLIFNNIILYQNNRIDTLKIDRGTTFPGEGDKVFMRRRSYMIDKYYAQRNPNSNVTQTNPIDYNKVEGHKLVTQKVIATNFKPNNYRIETSYEDIWLLSHKSSPEKFCLYDVQTARAYPFELDESIFNLDRFSLAEPLTSSETAPSRDVLFSYLTSMTDRHIYLYVIKNGISLYRIANYHEILK
jgi:hypothetical protein